MAIAVKGAQTRRRWSKLKEWLEAERDDLSGIGECVDLLQLSVSFREPAGQPAAAHAFYSMVPRGARVPQKR